MLRDVAQRVRPAQLALLLSLVLTAAGVVSPGGVGAQLSWWPDPAMKTGLAVWVNETFEDPDFVSRLADALQQQEVDVVFVQISSAAATPNLQKLSDRNDPFTRDIQNLLNQLAARGLLGCATILSDRFMGAASQMARFVLVDHLVAFNTNRDIGDAGFRCVSTNLEMPGPNPTTGDPGFRNSTVYDQWKTLHINMKARLVSQGSDMALLTWMQRPDFLVEQATDQAVLLEREGIMQVSDPPHPLFSGAMKYFTTQDGAAIFDAVIPLWFFADVDRYGREMGHNATEVQNLPGNPGETKPFLIAGVKVFDGICRTDCVQTKENYRAVLTQNDVTRMSFSSFLGTAVFKWPIPDLWGTP